jgi:transketolase
MKNNLKELAKLVRYYSLVSTTEAGSGHPSSSLSATDVMTALMFGGNFKADLENPNNPNNDRLIFSKGHASPLFYSLYAAAGKVSETEMLSLRKFGSRLEGHPTLEFPYTEVPTGSLGQGLSVGLGMALNAKLDKLDFNTFVLLGDSELAEGSVWEAVQVAMHYQLDNLYAIVDVNRLGQRGQTIYGHDVGRIAAIFASFGWNTLIIYPDYSIEKISEEFARTLNKEIGQVGPTAIIVQTLKGKGVSFMEDKDGWHGRALTKEELKQALEELGQVDKSLVGEIEKPNENSNIETRNSKQIQNSNVKITEYKKDKPVATRKAYGNALVNIMEAYPNAVVLDAETSNSTYSEFVKKTHPERFYEMYIAEQNMVGAALGFSKRGKIPFVSTFACFLSRAFDQIRMSQYADANIKFCGSHAGVSIGEDGASQMALEDIAMFRTVLGGVVLYPSDAVSTEKLVAEAAKHHGNVYIRTTRKETPIIYTPSPLIPPPEGEGRVGVDHQFKIGGSCVLKSSVSDKATVVGAGVTLHEALAAYEQLKKEGINIRVIDLYSIKPLDLETLQKAAKETGVIITVEDHFKEGGLGEAVAAALCTYEVHHILESMAVTKLPKSGKPDELLAYEGINASSIVSKLKDLLNTN